MIQIDIPGRPKFELDFLVLDYNGTIAVDGQLIEGLVPLINRLAEKLQVFVLTADTFGSAAQQLNGVNCKLKLIGPEAQDEAKQSFIRELGPGSVVAIGNGMNDALMLKYAALGIAVIQQEGAAAALLLNADLICTSIFDGLALLENTKRLIATLRN